MSSEPDPASLLGELGTLRRRTRTARHAYWFPLALFGLLTCLSGPFYLPEGLKASIGPVAGGDTPLPLLDGFNRATGVQPSLGYYWLAALLGGLLLTLLWYRWHARQTGVATPARGYIAITGALTVLAVALPLLSPVGGLRWLSWLATVWPGDLTIRGTFPFFIIIAVGLWVLARAERSRALALIAAVYTGAAVLSSLYDTENILFRLGWTPPNGDWGLIALPNVLLPALVLLAAGAGAFAAQRRRTAP